MNTLYNGTKIIIGGIGAFVAIAIGFFFSVGGEGTVMLMILFYVVGLTMGPRVLFEFGGAGTKIHTCAGPVGVAFVKLAIKVFSSDGAITEFEIRKLNQYISREFGTEIGDAAELFAKKNPIINDSIFSICKPFAKMKPAHRVTFMYQLFTVASLGGHFATEEEAVLNKIAKYLYIGKKRFQFIKSKVIKGEGQGDETYQGQKESGHRTKSNKFYQKFFAQAEDPYFILGIERNASNDEIKSAYRELVKKFHPDLSMHKSEKFRNDLQEKMQEVNNAYEAIKIARGIK